MAGLTRLYEATAGSSWYNNSGWMGSSSPCSWFGVTCGETGDVEQLGLFANNVAGTIPPELKQLTALQHLNVAVGALSGTLPPSWLS